MVDQTRNVGFGGGPPKVGKTLLGYKALGNFTLTKFQSYLDRVLPALDEDHDAVTLEKGLKLSFQNYPPTDSEIDNFVAFLCKLASSVKTLTSDSPSKTICYPLMHTTAELLIERYERGEEDPRDEFSANLLKSSGALKLVMEGNPGMLLKNPGIPLENKAYSSLILTAAARKDLEDLRVVHEIIKALSPSNLKEISLPDAVFSDALEFAREATNYDDIKQVIAEIKAEFSK